MPSSNRSVILSEPFAQWQPDHVRQAALALADRMRGHRRELHRHPEVAWNEHRTAAYIEKVLAELGIMTNRVVGTGLVAMIPGTGPGVVGVRADMDALPVLEAEGRIGYRSTQDGVSHACGHDAHMAIALGLAELVNTATDLPGTVVIYFQPAEESDGGAKPMVHAGVLQDPVPDAVLALHASPRRDVGQIGYRSGPVVGSFDTVTLVVEGLGGHAAHPESAIDPITIAASIVTATQQMMTREIDPMHPAVITFGSIHGGTRANVIPDEVTLAASVRALLPETRTRLLSRFVDMARGIAGAHRATVRAEVVAGYPAGSNDPALTAVVAAAARRVLGDGNVILEEYPSLGSEDFFAFGDEGAPVCLFRLGVGNTEAGIDAPLHSSRFDLDEDALPIGLSVMVESIRALLTATASAVDGTGPVTT